MFKTLFIFALMLSGDAGVQTSKPSLSLQQRFGFAERLGAVGTKAVLELSILPGHSSMAPPSLTQVSSSQLPSASQSETSVTTNSRSPHQAAVAPGHSNKQYLLYFSLSFGMLALTVAILLFDIRRKSRSGKRDDTVS